MTSVRDAIKALTIYLYCFYKKKLSGTNLVAMYCQFYCLILTICVTAFPISTNLAEINNQVDAQASSMYFYKDINLRENSKRLCFGTI